jgi:diguanylate cyclase (GGDEF)-like protein
MELGERPGPRGRPDEQIGAVMVDIDHFKRVNDTYGHQTGDRALQATAAVLREQSREYDLVSRFGGEEFAVALPSATTADARAYTERVAQALALLRIADGLTVSTSAGISSLTAAGEPAGTLLSRADEALYAAKEGGRCRQASWAGEIVVGPRFSATIDPDAPPSAPAAPAAPVAPVVQDRPPARSASREIDLR